MPQCSLASHRSGGADTTPPRELSDGHGGQSKLHLPLDRHVPQPKQTALRAEATMTIPCNAQQQPAAKSMPNPTQLQSGAAWSNAGNFTLDSAALTLFSASLRDDTSNVSGAPRLYTASAASGLDCRSDSFV